MTPIVFITIEQGIPLVVGGTTGIKVVFLDYDTQDKLFEILDEVECSMSEEQIKNYIKQEKELQHLT